MERSKRLIQITMCCLFFTILSGCATIKDIPKGIAGTSTRVLEETRKDALKKTFSLSYNEGYAKVKEILNQQAISPYIYADDSKKKMIALYLSSTDTTSVGIFFTEESEKSTLIEISSPSIYAKEEIAAKIFTGIDKLLKPAVIEGEKADVKEETGNQKIN